MDLKNQCLSVQICGCDPRNVKEIIMKYLGMLVALPAVLALMGCEENINIYNTSNNGFSNDALHGNIVGKVVQESSEAKIIVSQEIPVDSTTIDPDDGSFRIENLPIGNYDLSITAENYRIYTRSNVMIQGGGTTYVGELDLSTVPNLVASHYPEDLEEIVYNNRFSRLTISMTFTRPMDRESVEAAFSTEPLTEGIFYWGTYTTAPSWIYFEEMFIGDAGFDPGATITTYSKITSFTYRIAQKDSYTDTTYHVTLERSASDTAGNHLRFPLEFSFSTIQSSSTINGIQTNPYHGDVDVDLISYSGIQITFPLNMNQAATENAITMTPDVDRIYLWPERNQLTIYTGGAFLADTTYTIEIDSTTEDLDGIPLGYPFSFSFSTASVGMKSTHPRNGQLFVELRPYITMWFNTYMVKSTVQNAFSISPQVSGSFSWGNGYSTSDKTAITFTPSSNLATNTKYTVTVETDAEDLFGSKLKESYTFSFVTMPE